MTNPFGYPGRPTVSMIPLGSMVSPFFENHEFTLLSDPNGSPSIVCRDAAGRKQWMLEIPQEAPDEADFHDQHQVFGNMTYDYYAYNTAQTGCLIAYRHLLYFLRGKRIVAIDTLKRDKAGNPAVLWTRMNQSPLPGIRLFRSAILVGYFEGTRYSNQENTFVHPLFVNARILCFQDMDTLYGVDPLTGELIWTRDSLSFQSYLTGDEENVYQLRSSGDRDIPGNPENRRGNFPGEISYNAIAIDPATGKETATGKLPPGVFHCFGTTLVCSGMIRQGGERCLEVYDLKDFLKSIEPGESFSTSKIARPEKSEAERNELRAKALSTEVPLLDGNVAGQNGPVQPLFRSKPLVGQAIFNITENGRILAIVTQSRDLQIYDLAAHQTLISSVRLPVVITPNPDGGNQPFRQNNRPVDFYLEFDGDDFLLLLITDNNINASTFVVNSNSGRRVVNNRSFLPGYPQRGVGIGSVMRYDKTGKPMWDVPYEVYNWHFLDSPKVSPFLLFGALVINEGGGRPLNSPVIWGLNKKTGVRDFGKEFEFDEASRSQQQYIKIFVDAAAESLIFLSSDWTVRGQWEQQ